MIKTVYTIGTLLVGGAEVFLTNLISKLNLNKYDVSIIVLDKENNTFLEKKLNDLGIKIYYLNKKDGFRPFTFIKIYRLLKTINPKIIHGNIGGMIYALPYVFLKKNIKVIHTTHTLASLEFGKLKRMVLKYFYKRSLIIPVVISNINYQNFLTTYKIPKHLIKIIYNGIDIDKFYFERKFNSSEIRLGHVGRFEEVKNHRVIFKVYESLINKGYNVSLKLIGNGSLLENYRKKYKDVIFIESSSEIAKELKDIDFFVFPSLYEGMPLAVIEAMASGCIILSSNVGGLNDLVEDGVNGYRFDFQNVEGFVQTIEMLYKDKKLMAKIAKNNQKKVSEYSLTEMVRKYEELYKG